MSDPNIELHRGWQPGLIGAVTAMHARYYAANWGFGPYFEAKVAREMAAFVDRYDPLRDLTISAVRAETIVGAITIDCSETGFARDGAHLRWFITDPSTRGTGLGRRLLDQAMDHLGKIKVDRAYLTSFAGLDAARHLYEQVGFVLEDESTATTWGIETVEQLFVWRAGRTAPTA